MMVIINPVFFTSSLFLIGRVRTSDHIWGNMIVTGFFIGVASVLGSLLGQGSLRWGLLVAALAETFIWWFMAIGL